MKKLLLFTILASATLSASAQTVTIYRAGVAISPTYSKVMDATLASLDGDSIVLSAHTFKEHDLPFKPGRVWKGTMTTTDTSIIDAEHLSGFSTTKLGSGIIHNVVLRDIIFINGEGGGVAPCAGLDTLMLKGYTVIRNCHTIKSGAALTRAFLYDHTKICNNVADSFGGVGFEIWVHDSVEICYNTAAYGGAVGYVSGGKLTCHSPGVRIHHNTATVAGGAIYGMPNMSAGQITDNQAPLGAALWTFKVAYTVSVKNCYIYNPSPSGNRQNELFVQGPVAIDGSWFGQSDTTGLITTIPSIFGSGTYGKPARANWSVNWGKALSKKDTLFPIGAGFTYSDGSLLPANACPWLVGNFSSSVGTFLTPQPIMQPNDTLSSLFRTYVYASKGDTSSKPISYVCSIDADTFRATPMVWGRDTSNLSIFSPKTASQVFVYPNPSTDYLHIQGAAISSTISLYDLQGKLVKSEEAKGHNVEMDVQALPKGNYLLKITTKEGEEGSAKVLKE